MSSELAVLPTGLVSQSKYSTSETKALVSKSTSFFNRVQMFSFSSDLCKKGKFPAGNWGLVKGQGNNNITNLGEEFSAYLFSWRPKCVFIDKAAGKVSVWHCPKTYADKFAKAEAMADQKGMTGWMYGAEFFLYLPEYEEFATFFLNNPTLRGETDNIMTLLQKPPHTGTFKIMLIEKKNTWHGLLTLPCKTILNLPERDTEAYTAWVAIAQANVDKFNNAPPSSEESEGVEVVSEPVASGRER